MKLDVTGWINNAKVDFPIIKLAKFPSIRNQLKEVLVLEPMSQANNFLDEGEYSI
jgi:hypothetical protein